MKAIRGALVLGVLGALAAACVPVTEPPTTTTTAPSSSTTSSSTSSTSTSTAPTSSTSTTSTTTAGGPPTLTATDYVTGLSKPWDVAFLPNGEPIYTENDSGSFSVGAGAAKRAVGSIDTLDGSVSFSNNGEGGLMGIALDPAFATNHFVYACYSTTTDNRVVRLTLDYPTSTALSGYTTLVTGMGHSSIHNGCRLGFQPGSSPPALFVTIGDAQIGPGPQSDTTLNGKVLRINTDGSAYAGNASGQLWYTKGHRNPQGITFRPGTDVPFSIEHGPDKNDEVNQLVNGGNGGWNPTNGSDYEQSKSMNGPTATMTPVWTSGNVTVAPSGGTFLSGAQWKTWDGALAVACLDGSPSVGQRLLIMTLSADGSTTTAVVPQLVNSIRLRTAVQGPDGNLYIVTDVASGGGKILKVVPS